MCDACALADTLLDAAGEFALRRPLTDHEAVHGDIPRIAADFDAAELAVAKAAAPVVTKLVRQLLEEVGPLLKKHDLAGISRVSPSYVAELATALSGGMSKATKAGRAQVADAHGKYHIRLAGARNDVSKAEAYLAGRSVLSAQQLADAMAARVRAAAVQAAVKGETEWTDEEVAALEDGSTQTLAGFAMNLAREAYGVGRSLAMTDVADDITTLTYSAVLDNSTCDTCAAADGDLYSDDASMDPAGSIEDGIAACPNPDCEGMAYGNVCRCVCIADFSSGGQAINPSNGGDDG